MHHTRSRSFLLALARLGLGFQIQLPGPKTGAGFPLMVQTEGR